MSNPRVKPKSLPPEAEAVVKELTALHNRFVELVAGKADDPNAQTYALFGIKVAGAIGADVLAHARALGVPDALIKETMRR